MYIYTNNGGRTADGGQRIICPIWIQVSSILCQIKTWLIRVHPIKAQADP